MKLKRGQVTIFVILALVIVVLGTGYFLFLNSPKSSVKVNSNPVSTFVQDCLQKASEKSIINVGLGGGYFYSSPVSTPDGIAYYWNNGTNNMPTIQTIQSEISKGVSKELLSCIKNMSFPNYEISKGDLNVTTTIHENKVLISADYPIQVKKENTTSTLRDFNWEVPVRLGFIYNLVQNFTLEEPNKEGICLSCIYDISSKNEGLKTSMFDYGPTTVLFDINDTNIDYKIGRKDFEWIFANNYTNGL